MEFLLKENRVKTNANALIMKFEYFCNLSIPFQILQIEHNMYSLIPIQRTAK